MKKVLIHEIRTIVARYRFPVLDGSNTVTLAPRMSRCTNPQAEPAIWFRVVLLGQFDHRGAAVAYYRDQAVEIALGPAEV